MPPSPRYFQKLVPQRKKVNTADMNLQTTLMKRILGFSLLISFIATFQFYSFSSAESCMESGERRILQPFADKRKTLEFYVKKSCGKSARTILEINSPIHSPERQEKCRNKILVDVYISTCIYFRDVVYPEAFNPCWDWGREHYAHCVAGDAAWFGK